MDDNTKAARKGGRRGPAGSATSLTEAHRAYLRAHAITDETIEAVGIFSLDQRAYSAFDEFVADVPEGLRWVTADHRPCIVFPCRSIAGRIEYVIRPDFPGYDENTRPNKYLTRSRAQGYVPVLWAVRHIDDPDVRLFVEGMKQALAAASYAAEGVAVYGFGSKDGWMQDGVPIADLAVVDGDAAVACFDADAGGNVSVYDSARKFGEALTAEGAESVKYVRLPAGGSAGLDDVLASRPAERRADYLAKLIAGAKPKPADQRPRAKPKPNGPPAADDGRVTVVCNDDRRKVIDELTRALIAKFDGTELFDYGGVVSRLVGHEMHPIDAASFSDVVQHAAVTVWQSEKGFEYGWPDGPTMRAVLSRAGEFTPLDQVRRAPFVRSDGSVCAKPGYDADSRTFLVLDESLGEVVVPDEPTDDEIEAAVSLILDDWLGDMDFKDDASRANALALVVTVFVRHLLPRVPLAVIDGKQMGSAKNLLADCVAILATGEDADPLGYTTDDAEMRKGITSAFRTGAELFIFDEAHSIQGSSLARALTASSWKDRILGVSIMAEYPNRVTWVSLGNQVTVTGDMVRRVYRIALWPDHANPQDRPASDFKHPDLADWTRQNRGRLIQAVLTLVRAWFADGRQPPIRRERFGSFEAWEGIVGGIVERANVDGFLDNLSAWRSESDFGSQYWAAHLAWVYRRFGEGEFTAAEVKNAALKLSDAFDDYEGPPGLTDMSGKDYARELGQSYHRVKDRNYGGYRVTKSGTGHDNKSKWKIVHDPPDSTGGPGGPGESPTPSRVRETNSSGAVQGENAFP